MADTPAPQNPAEGILTPEQARADIAASETDADAGKGGKEAVLADLAKERAERKKLSKELDQLRAASLSDSEKAVAEAEKRGEAKAVERYAARLVDESFRAATVGRTLTPDSLLTFDRSDFITDDGDVDRPALTRWVEDNTAPTESPRLPSFDGGARNTPPAAAGMNGLIRKATGRA